MKRWGLVLALLLSLGLNIGVFGTLVVKRAQARRAAAAVGPGGLEFERIADRLELGGGERLRFIASQRRFVSEIRRGARELAEERRELREALTSPLPDADLVRSLVARTGERATELDMTFAENVLQVRETLDGPAEARYLRFLAQMYSRERAGAGPGARRRGRGR